MRSIGKWKIKKLQKIVNEEMSRGIETYTWRGHTFEKGIKPEQRILRRVPTEWYDTWESALSEIDRLINDMVWAYKTGRRSYWFI